MNENKFQRILINRIKQIFPDCVILKNDPNYMPAIPDLLILNGPNWAMLETKRSEDSSFQPNQEYYIEKLDSMSYARAVYPENLEEVLDELQQSL